MAQAQTRNIPNAVGVKAWAVGNYGCGWTVYVADENQDLSIGYAETLDEAAEVVYDYATN